MITADDLKAEADRVLGEYKTATAAHIEAKQAFYRLGDELRTLVSLLRTRGLPIKALEEAMSELHTAVDMAPRYPHPERVPQLPDGTHLNVPKALTAEDLKRFREKLDEMSRQLSTAPGSLTQTEFRTEPRDE